MINYETGAGRATITINDPDRRNPLSTTVMQELCDATRSALADDTVRAIVFTGAGEKAFSAGGDLSGGFVDDALGRHGERGVLAELFRLMFRGGKPTVARVNGHALAGGFGLAVACDVTVCVDDAMLGVTEIKVGLWPMMISAVLLRAMPRKAVLELMMTGRTIDAFEAHRLGAVSRVVGRGDLDSVVDEVVESIIAASPSSLMIGRDALFGIGDRDFDSALDRLQGGLTEIALTEDAAEGVEAFVSKRAPEWTGR